MGGVNFTRNRAWWHTAIWDEYGQRHQYLCFIPSLIFMIPTYWYGSFINRALEQNWAAKMYQLEFESRRNRITHNMIMEHFESHVEKIQDILGKLNRKGTPQEFIDVLTKMRDSTSVISSEVAKKKSEWSGSPPAASQPPAPGPAAPVDYQKLYGVRPRG